MNSRGSSSEIKVEIARDKLEIGLPDCPRLSIILSDRLVKEWRIRLSRALSSLRPVRDQEE